MTLTRPQAAQAADRGVDRARLEGGGRLTTVIQDFLLDPALRLTEGERAAMTAMLYGLVSTLADELRVRLPDPLAELSACDPFDLIAQLRASQLLGDPRLVALLLRRSGLPRMGDPAANGGGALLQAWAGDDVPAVAAAAMAVILARAASRDRFGQPGVQLADLDAETAVAMTYAVAAALAVQAEPDTADEFVAAAVDLLGRHDEGQRLEALEARLVIALESAARLDGTTLAALAAHGEMGLLAEALARLARIPVSEAWKRFDDPAPGQLALLLRMADQPRAIAGAILAAIEPADPELEIDAFDQISDRTIAAAQARARRPEAFAAAIGALTSRD